MSQSGPERVMHSLNQALLDAADVEDDRFCTAIFGLLTADERVVLRLASGGPPPIVVRRASGQVRPVHLGVGSSASSWSSTSPAPESPSLPGTSSCC